MFIREFDSDIVRCWIQDCAYRMVDDYVSAIDVETRLHEVVEDTITYPSDALAIITYYGAAFDALTYAGDGFEDSPMCMFEDDVMEMYRKLTEDKED